jgi:lantibiotic modifying enzyme
VRRSRRWRPIVSGSLGQQALDAVLGIAEGLRRPPPVPDAGLLDDDGRAARELGLLTGRAGIAVFFGYLSETELYPDAEDLAWQFLDEAEAGLAARRLGASLTSGISGIAWVHDHLTRHLSGARDRGELREIDDALVTMLRESNGSDEYDLLYGLVGIGVYALERLPARAARTMARLVVERLAEQAVDVAGSAAWWTPEGAVATQPEGHFDLGMAHGAPGVVGFLARAAAAGIAPRTTPALLERASSWLLARQSPPDSATAFAQSCDVRGTPGPPGRTAWCYGDPGVVAGLFAAARASGNAAWLRDSVRIATKAAARRGTRSGVVDAGLCHGSAGLAQVFNRMYQATGKREFRSSAVHWIERTLAYRHPGRGIGGLTAIRSRPSEPLLAVSDPGVLTGSAGIGLALHAAATSVEPAWDRMLLLDNGRPLR